MSRRITVNVGFITNSSSCVYYFPRKVLLDPEVKAFIESYELTDGYVGRNLWHRGECSSFLVTRAQKEDAKKELRSYSWDDEREEDFKPSAASEAINPDDDGVYVIYGDEYSDETHILCRLLSSALIRLQGGNPDEYTGNSGYVTDYN